MRAYMYLVLVGTETTAFTKSAVMFSSNSKQIPKFQIKDICGESTHPPGIVTVEHQKSPQGHENIGSRYAADSNHDVL